ncbi:MAG: TetR/AcrR family transcriptional regulator [Planctomycetota bacterium]|nr:MAG: TetR/AcrR family transcriptional regulator [Planctomycetota bacterium]
MPRSAPEMPGRLAQSAFQLFSERGFEAVTLDQIAARAGVTKGSFYSHFKSKQDIIRGACAHYYRSYQRRVHEALAPLSDPTQRLRRVLELSVRTCVLDRGNRVFTTEIFALLLQDEEVRRGWMQFYDTVREMYLGLVHAVQVAEREPVPDPRRAVDLMLAAMEGIKMRAAFEPQLGDRCEQEAIVSDLLRILGFPLSSPSFASSAPTQDSK